MRAHPYSRLVRNHLRIARDLVPLIGLTAFTAALLTGLPPATAIAETESEPGLDADAVEPKDGANEDGSEESIAENSEAQQIHNGRNVEPFGRPTGHKTLVKLITQTIRYRQRDGDRRGR